MQEDIKEEAALKVLDFSDDVDHAPDQSGNFTAAFIPLDKACSFLQQNKTLFCLFFIIQLNNGIGY